MTLRSIAELLGRHNGAEAWIFGKGSSLDDFDISTASPLRICINESLLVVSEASYFFAHDEVPIQRVAPYWPSGCCAILQPVRGNYAVSRGIPSDAIFTYEKRERQLDVLNWPAERIAREASLLGLTGTVHSALHFCRLIGAVSVVFVGMDAGPAYARCLDLAPPPGGGRHDLIRRDSIMVAKDLGLDYQFIDAQTNRLPA